MREIKFRQPLFSRGKFSGFHYWGFISDGNFSGPTGELVKAREQSQQFTGLLDRSGKEIYEGDLVKDWSDNRYAYESEPYVIKWDINCFNTKRLSHLTEVIGNIYENPDLLKEE